MINPTAVGIGLRSQHLAQILQEKPDIDYLEILVDNCLRSPHTLLQQLQELSQYYALSLHGVALNLAGYDPLDFHYLKKIKQLKNNISASWYSEHACFSQVKDHYIPDLLPIPFTNEAVSHLVSRIIQVQDFLGERILLENVSSYITFNHNTMSEGQFIATVSQEADCHILLDINNIYVNQFNHGNSAVEFLHNIPLERVKQIHLAGYQDCGDYYLDTHGCAVNDDVWSLYKTALDFLGRPVPSLIEWDNDIPVLEKLLHERDRAKIIVDHTFNKTGVSHA